MLTLGDARYDRARSSRLRGGLDALVMGVRHDMRLPGLWVRGSLRKDRFTRFQPRQVIRSSRYWRESKFPGAVFFFGAA